MNRRVLRLVTATLAIAATVASLTTPASAGVSQKGRVVHVGDGDTVDVDIWGDGTATPQRIRLTGIQAMELTTYSRYEDRLRGECHSVRATKRLRTLIEGKVVRVTARYASSMSGSRYRRTVWVYLNGAWRDVAQILLREGHGIWLPNSREYGPNKATSIAAQQAAAERRGLWDSDFCGVGPYQAVPLRVTVKWDADGDDSKNPNGEWIRVTNAGSVTVPLGGWRVRDSAYRGYLGRGYVFPVWVKVPPRGSVYVHAGKGTNTATHVYWGLERPIFENASGDPTYLGDGGYLFDPQGDMRAWHQYPCRHAC